MKLWTGTAIRLRAAGDRFGEPVSRLLVTGLTLAFFLTGCASAPPPPPKSEARLKAERAEAAGRQEYQRQNWAAAALLFQQAGEVYRVVDDFAAAASARHNEGQALRQQGDYPNAIQAFEDARNMNETTGRIPAQAENLAGLAQCFAAQGRMEEAIGRLEQGLAMKLDDPAVRAALQNDLALLLLKRGAAADRPRLLNLLAEAREANQGLRNAPAVAVNELNLGRSYLAFGELDPAETHLLQALERFRSLDDPQGLALTHEACAHLYAARQDPDRMRFHLERARDKYAYLKDEAGLKRLAAIQ